VIPGLSSALAAPALAGIPLTHRGLAAGFTVVSGHSEEAFAPLVSALPPGSSTLVVLMGLGTRARLVELLLAAGWAPTTPAALLLAASTPDAFCWVGTLAGLASVVLPPHRPSAQAPGTLVIGQVVALAKALAPAPPANTAQPSPATAAHAQA
jgi:uroporphyrin-III C-methyltransferase/precorrin-2 dehydrogenase/sirohydrochlorin ferrochelatase